MNSIPFKILYLLLFTIFFTDCQNGDNKPIVENPSKEEVFEKTRQVINNYVEGHYNSDAIRAAAGYAEEVIIVGEGSTFYKRSDIEEFYRMWYESFKVEELSVEPEEFELTGPNAAYEIGIVSIKLKDIQGDSLINSTTKFLTIWENDPENGWLVSRGMSVEYKE